MSNPEEKQLKRFYVHTNPTSGVTFVKDDSLFQSQGGLDEEWGYAWTPVSARDLEEAREIGKNLHKGAILRGLAPQPAEGSTQETTQSLARPQRLPDADPNPEPMGQCTLRSVAWCFECDGQLDPGMQAMRTAEGFRCIEGSRACKKGLASGDLAKAKDSIKKLKEQLEVERAQRVELEKQVSAFMARDTPETEAGEREVSFLRERVGELKRTLSLRGDRIAELNDLVLKLQQHPKTNPASAERTIAWVHEQGNELSRLCEETQTKGQSEYAHGAGFGNFERAAELFGISRETVLAIFMWKHFDGIASWIKGHRSQRESVKGRILDASVYLRLLYAMVIDLEERDELDVSPEPAQGEAEADFSVLKELLERAPDDPGSAMFLKRVLEHLVRELEGSD